MSTSLNVLITAALVGSALVAQAPAVQTDLPEWLKAMGVTTGLLGGPVFAIWGAHYMLTKHIPRLEKSYEDQLEKIEERHTAYTAMLIGNFREDQRQMWSVKKETDDRVIETINRLIERLNDGVCGFREQHDPPQLP